MSCGWGQRPKDTPVGLYLHVPFCRKKCAYCDFYSLPAASEEAFDRYRDALLRCLRGYREEYGAFPVDTVYFGGGTPSVLGAGRLAALLEEVSRFSLEAGAEMTLEANPETVDAAFLRACREMGFTRISFGIQSAVEGELQALGRIHSFAQAARAAELSLAAGFAHVSGDVMVGIPYQTPRSLGYTLEAVAALGVDHISAYLLKLEEGTPLARRAAEYTFPDEDTLCDAYLGMVEKLGELGFAQYEISNFAKPGGQSRHNRRYWERRPYLGLGPGAHSYFGGKRFSYPRDLAAFLTGPPFALEEEDCDPETEQVMLGLRLTEGLPYAALGQGLFAACAPLRQAGLIAPDRERLRLMPQGFLLSNQVIGFVLDKMGL
ncbi:MAG: radical SAM family heme chaperone HemW [Oscillospiraceae bacterium]|jgi:oxygen-independent coproporphyrinogen-3 oxidase|nr:radical SAM family heme chaperone HemW [Oscillospiraceae bacterium]